MCLVQGDAHGLHEVAHGPCVAVLHRDRQIGVLDVGAEQGISLDESSAVSAIGSGGSYNAYEIPFTLMQCVTLVMVLAVLSVGGMLMTDLVQNMWSYSETDAPVSSLTDTLINTLGLKPGQN